jgi:hypothetical protein
MLLVNQTQANWIAGAIGVAFPPEQATRARIMAAVDIGRGQSLNVAQETLRRYYAYLLAHLSLPFPAYYPEPTTSMEKDEFRLTVVELLDPDKHLGDELDGIFCKTRKGQYEINLPLVELSAPRYSANFQLIEDYSHWFWHWR